MPHSASDSELVRAAQSGQAHAFATLVERTQGMARAIAFSSTGDYDGAQDLAQEALVTAWTRLADLKEPGKFRPWLAGIVRNTARYWRRHQHRHAPAAQEGLEAIEALASDQLSPLDQVQHNEDWQEASEALRTLPTRYREPLLLFYTLDESHAEVACALGLTEAAVRQRLCRARKKLRDELEPARASGRRLANAASAAAAIMLVITSRQAWAAPASTFSGSGTLGASKIFLGLGALAGGALIALTAALILLVSGAAPRSLPGDERSYREQASANEDQAIAEELAHGKRADSTSMSMALPTASVRIGAGKVKEREQNFAGSALAPAARRSTEKTDDRGSSASALSERASSGGRIRKHGPAVIEEEPEARALLRPSLSIGDVQRELWGND